MKNIFKYFGMAAMALTMVGLVACKDEPVEPTPQPEPDNSVYALHYLDATSAAVRNGDTVDYTPESWEYELSQTSSLNIYIENRTSNTLSTVQEVTMLQGPEGQRLEVCAGGNCPWNGNPYDIAPGTDTDKPITVEAGLSNEYSGISLIRVKVGRAGTMDDAVTVYVRVHLG